MHRLKTWDSRLVSSTYLVQFNSCPSCFWLWSVTKSDTKVWWKEIIDHQIMCDFLIITEKIRFHDRSERDICHETHKDRKLLRVWESENEDERGLVLTRARDLLIRRHSSLSDWILKWAKTCTKRISKEELISLFFLMENFRHSNSIKLLLSSQSIEKFILPCITLIIRQLRLEQYHRSEHTRERERTRIEKRRVGGWSYLMVICKKSRKVNVSLSAITILNHNFIF